MREKAESSLQTGRTVGNYVLTRNLGEGTFGKVKLGIHSLTGEKVAVKVLEKSKIVDVADVERVTREIHILKQIRHPNLVQLYEIIETPKQLFLVMEYVSEGELFELIVKKKRLKEAEACEYFRQIVAGVEYLHELGIVHRDLKPENLLLDFNRSLKLVDFGLSNTYKHKELLKTACGSPCYAAPEMIAGKKYQGLGADLWSCGVVLFAMICGYLPFEDPNTTALYKKIIAGEYTIPKFVSPLARQMIMGLLTTDPEKRFRLRDVKAHAWFREAAEAASIQGCGIKVGVQSIPVDGSVLQQLKDYNEDANQAKKYIENNRHNHSITIYYLLLKKQLRAGTHSPHDICSPTFDPAFLVPPAPAPKEKTQEAHKEKSQATTAQDIEEIQLDRMATAVAPRSNRIISRLSHLRESKEMRRKEDAAELKMELDNLPIVDKTRATGQQKRRIHQIIMGKEQKEQPEEVSLYDVEQPLANKFNQTIAGGWRRPVPALRTSLNKTPQQARREERGSTERGVSERGVNDRYRSVEVEGRERSEDKAAIASMNKTFMGRIPHAYIPRWENESERIRSILNTTISGHGKRNKPKFSFYI